MRQPRADCVVWLEREDLCFVLEPLHRVGEDRSIKIALELNAMITGLVVWRLRSAFKSLVQFIAILIAQPNRKP
jgi:hypothetical protein